MYNVEFSTVEKKVFLIEHQLDDLSFIEDFKNLIDTNISELSYKTNVKGKMTKWDTFVSNKDFQKIILNSVDIIKYFAEDGAYCDNAWGNKLENDDEVISHHHIGPDMVMSGLLYLTEDGPGTYFKEFNKTIKEKIGKIVFFSPEVWHSVSKSNLNKTRYTLSFNLRKLNESK
jgi:hypothetical protein